MEKAPEIIEAYDISNFGSETVVGGMVVFENARPKKSDYKKFSIKTVVGTDDYACMCEMLERRFNHYFEEQGSGSSFGRMPDLILLDGGKGHVAAVQELFDRMGVTVPLFGMVKDDRHRTRAIAKNGGEIAISPVKSVFNFVTSVQDEVHRYAVAYHRKKHTKSALSATLTQIKGIGEKKAKNLIIKFKTMEAIRNAAKAELMSVPGITEANAIEIIKAFRGE